MSPLRTHLTSRPALISGIVLFSLHSLLVVITFLHVYANRGVAQAELEWLPLLILDFPTVDIAWAYLAPTAPMRALFEWGYTIVGSGPNLRSLVLVGLAGGLHWFVLGGAAGAWFSWRRARSPLRQ
jgi:hypothetical protein